MRMANSPTAAGHKHKSQRQPQVRRTSDQGLQNVVPDGLLPVRQDAIWVHMRRPCHSR